MYVFGGDTSLNSEECTANSNSAGHAITDEVFVFNMKKKRWSQLSNVKMPPLKRFAFDQIGDEVYLYGGFNYYCDNPGFGIADGHVIWNSDLYVWKI